MLQHISISNKCCSFELYSSKNPENKCFSKIIKRNNFLMLTGIKLLLEHQSIKIISKESYNITGINYILKYITMYIIFYCNNILPNYCFHRILIKQN